MKVQEVINCSFDRWYPSFKTVTFKSILVPITSDVLAYLRSNSTIILPKSCQAELDSDLKANRDEFDSDDDAAWDNQPVNETKPIEQDESSDDEEDLSATTAHPDFPAFDSAVRSALATFNNKVFIKLNWSSPKDAYWSLSKMHCERLSDVYIMLRSSDFVSHDLNEAFKHCEDVDTATAQLDTNFTYYLVVREWLNINPSMEFRCFVHRNQLIGISQRDCRSFYAILLDNKVEILDRIERFYLESVHSKFASESYAFDVCLGKKNIKLTDFNPFGATTDSLMYSWEELADGSLMTNDESEATESYKSSKLELRLVETNSGVHAHQYSMYSQPLDLMNLNEMSGTDIESIVSLIEKNIDSQKNQTAQTVVDKTD